jgi:hypothetical protein
MQSKEKLITLCGLSKEEAELDFSGQDLRAGDAVLIANDISDMGALTQLDISSNNLSGRAVNAARTGYDYDFTGVQALANALPKCR